MKKVLFLLAVAGLVYFASCKSAETKVETAVDTTAAQVQATVDTAAAVVDSVAK